MRHTYPGTLRRRGATTWWWRYQIEGRRYSRSFEAPDRRAAERHVRNVLLAEVEAEDKRHRAGLVIEPRVSDLLDEFTRDYLPSVVKGTRYTYQNSLDFFRRFFVEQHGNPLVTAVRKTDVSRYLDWRRTQRGGTGKGPVSQRTLRKDYQTLGTLFEWAVQAREYRANNPVEKKLKPKRGDERQAHILSDAEVDRLLTACEGRPMLYLFVILCHETGLRPNSEALWLRWEDVDLRREKLKVVSGRDGHRTKTGKTRVVPLSEDLLDALREHGASYRLVGGSPWVFHHLHRSRRYKAGERIGNLLHSFQNAAERAKLPDDLRPYDLRHTRITKWVAAGHNLALVQKAAGHASIRTTMGYVHLVDDDLSALVAPPTPPAPVIIDLKQRLAAG
jgi:integrase